VILAVPRIALSEYSSSEYGQAAQTFKRDALEVPNSTEAIE
jgi:hypothetical protein